MTLPSIHFAETKALLKKIPKSKVAKWLLQEGYYPEEYILPPCFVVKTFELKSEPYVITEKKGSPVFNPERKELLELSYPKTQLTHRSFGVIEPKLYHDIVWFIIDEWDMVVDHLFDDANRIFSYSFPIPVSKKNEGNLGYLRAGRMIYEFLEMAENDLVAEASDYKYILKTDISNFYPSIYTHSVSWALHEKSVIRQKGERSRYDKYLGLKLDRLLQQSNDGRTNGIAVGPAISDLISEIVLSAIDIDVSKELDNKEIDYLAVRFKDDYRFLCNTKKDANIIIKILQRYLHSFNLTLNEKKTNVSLLPEGLFRDWPMEYSQYSLKFKRRITYKEFERSLRKTIDIDENFPNTGVIDRFLSELYSKYYNLKFKFSDKDTLKAISLLLFLKKRRSKSFPHILAILEKILEQHSDSSVITDSIKNKVVKMLNDKLQSIDENEYDLIWLIYFVKSNQISGIGSLKNVKSPFIKSLKANRTEFFKPKLENVDLFITIKSKAKNKKSLLKHVAVFNKEPNN